MKNYLRHMNFASLDQVRDLLQLKYFDSPIYLCEVLSGLFLSFYEKKKIYTRIKNNSNKIIIFYTCKYVRYVRRNPRRTLIKFKCTL